MGNLFSGESSALPEPTPTDEDDLQSSRLERHRDRGTYIPEDVLSNSAHATVLNLSGRKGIQLRDDLKRFTHLRELRLGNCLLERIPEGLCELTELEVLDLEGNSIQDGIPHAIGQLVRLQILDLSRCQLTCLPDSIGNLEQLKKLYLCGNAWIGGLPHTIGRLVRLEMLDLSFSHLADLPDSIGNLKRLEVLELSFSDFKNGLTHAIGQLVQLPRLDLNRCRLTSVPDSIGNLKQLKELKLCQNKLSGGLTVAIGRLVQLQKLDLSYSELPNLPDSIGDLKQLEELELDGNHFTGGLTNAIGRLVRLQKLSLISCQLTDVPDSIGNLKHLKVLKLYGNNFSSRLTPAIGRLNGLQKLDLRHCQLSNVPDSIGDLEQLTELDLGRNKLQDYPLCTLRLKTLRTLDLSHHNSPEGNSIKHLPMALAYTSLLELDLKGNPITEPPQEVWQQGIHSIKSFMEALVPGRALIHADTLNMIGDTGAGKTSVAQSLVARSPRTTDKADRTRVLQQFPMKIDERFGHSVNINDFGGHEIYHSVMPIFLPANGLVIIVFSLNDEEQEKKVRKWLLTAISKSTEIRVIIVGTHADKVSGQRVELEAKMNGWKSTILKSATDEVDDHIIYLTSRPNDVQVESKLRRLQQLQENLQKADISVVALSCLNTEEGRSDEGLLKLFTFVEKLLHPPRYLPIHWCQVMNGIINHNALYITMTQVEDICKAYFTDVENSEARATILRYLSRTSQIIWLENHESLGDVVFHSPVKIIDLCKCVLHHSNYSLENFRISYEKEVEEYENGILSERLLKRMLHSQAKSEGLEGLPNKELFNVVCNLLQEFNLASCVTADNEGKKFIIPCKLSSSAPQQLECFEIKESSCLNRVVVQLSFIGSTIPLSFFETSLSSMLTVAGDMAHHYIWRDGLIIFREEVCFIAKRLDPIITLSAFTELKHRRPWTLLHPMLKRLHDNVTWSWHGTPPDCVILCPCCLRRIQREEGEQNVGQIRSDLMTLAAASVSWLQLLTERMKCKKCTESDLLSLCLPQERTVLLTNLRLESAYIAERLSDGEVIAILQKLHSANQQCILPIEKEDVESEKGATRRATKLLDILRKKSADVIWTFQQILRDVNKSDLADRLLLGRPDEH